VPLEVSHSGQHSPLLPLLQKMSNFTFRTFLVIFKTAESNDLVVILSQKLLVAYYDAKKTRKIKKQKDHYPR